MKKKGVYYGWWVVIASFFLLFLFAGAGFYSFSIFIKPLEESFGWSRSQISFAMSLYLIIHGLCGPLVGHLTETYGPKRVMTLFALGSGAAFILISFTPSLWYFYGAYSILSMMTTGIGFIPISAILSRWFVRRRGTAIGMAMVGISFGGLVMSPLIGTINEIFSWRASFVFLGVLVWVVAIPLTVLVMKGYPGEIGLLPDGDAPEDTGGKEDSSKNGNGSLAMMEQGWPLRKALRSRAFWWISATFFLAPLGQMGVLQHQVPLITESGISPAVAAAALGFTAGLGGLGKLSFGRISELIPFHFTAMLCFGLQALGVFILYHIDSAVMMWLHVGIFGFAMGGVVVLVPMVVGQFFGLVSFGVIMGIVSFSQAVGSSLGAIISGVVYDYFGSYQYALIFYIGVYLTAILTIFLAGKPREYVGEQKS
ncbi:MAG: MFS transporter [Proteobacteria bacterium]|nr:MFS transporter [Pseudomonadota bacterium]